MMLDIRTMVAKDIEDAKRVVLDSIKKRHEEASRRIKESTTMTELQKTDAQQNLDASSNRNVIRLDGQNRVMADVDRILEPLIQYQTKVDQTRKTLIEGVSNQAKEINNKVTNMLNRASAAVRDFQRKIDNRN